jgi:hypothetical protein
MDSHGWRIVYATIRQVDKAVPRTGRKKQYSDVLIVAMFLWTVCHDWPMCWACQRWHHGGLFRPRCWPSVGHFSRRIRSERCQHLLQEVERRLAESDVATPLSFLDARPLVVGPCSKDRQAKPGRIYGGFARGYKLHAVVSEDARVRSWCITPLNVAESRAAESLLTDTPLKQWLLADGNYDASVLYDLADRQGCQLLTPLPEHAGCGHRPQSPARLRALELWRSGTAEPIYRLRWAVERCFGNQSSFGGGLNPLPAWVRTLPRVINWVCGKLIVYHVRRRLRQPAA